MKLYPFQRQVAELLLGGRNVILQAPTGAGKTMAAMLPYLDTLEHGRDFPHKCIYAVPMRVLANQFVAEYSHLVKKAGRDDRIRVAIQTGEHSDDRELDASLTFATIDQVLSSFLLSPYSLPRRLSNLNAGAVAASYLVFDEFHLFDPISTLPTTLAMLRMLDGIAPFLLMTATFSRDMLSGLAKALNAVVVPEDDAALEAMQGLASQNKVRRYHLCSEPLSADAVLGQHKTHTLVVCNVVNRARALYEAVRDHSMLGDSDVYLLHSRFLPEDRQRIEGQVRARFAKGGEREKGCIVIATQVIEVGLDITCQCLHTELAPANAILQRAGRCARYEGEEGDVFIYSSSCNDRGEGIDLCEHTLPYRGLEEEIERTARAFHAHHEQVLGFGEEQAIITFAHGPRDRLLVQGLTATQEVHRRRMNQTMDGQRSGQAGDLIRAVASQRVVVHDDPLSILERPFAAESFSLHPGSVHGLVKDWLEWEQALDLDDWGVRALRDLGDKDEKGRTAYDWVCLDMDNRGDVAGSPLVLVHPILAGYDRDMGFMPDRETGYRAAIAPAKNGALSRAYGGYRLETYQEHARLVYQAFNRQAWPELARAAARLEQVFGWPEGVVERAAHLAALLHDAGKLGHGWQTWVQRYQQAIGQPAPEGYYAHTDYQPGSELHLDKQKALGRRPPHAAEGALAMAPILAVACEGCEPVFRAAFTAIARHHGAFTREYQSYTLVSGAQETIAETLEWLPSGMGGGLDTSGILASQRRGESEIDDLFVDPGHDDQFLAYVLLARGLRRADQRGTALGAP